MNIVITGGAGFLGRALTVQLLAMRSVDSRAVSRITLLDLVEPPVSLINDPRIQYVVGDLVELLDSRSAIPPDTDLIFHLAAAVSSDCERDFDLGMRSNVQTTQLLLQTCRALSLLRTVPVRLVFASSVAVFGGSLPAIVQDDTLPQPQSSYGIQKFICEQLVADYTRKGFVDGRSSRLMTVSVRPGQPNGAASGFLSGIAREPLAGKRAICPVSPDTQVALSTAACSVEGLLAAASASPDIWGSRLAMNLPALTVSVSEMVAALVRVAGPAAADLIDWVPDSSIQRIVGSWPSRIAASRANLMGLQAAASFDDVIRAYLDSARSSAKSV